MDVMTKLSDFFFKSKQMDSGRKVVLEMEKVEEEFYSAYEAAREYLDSQKEGRSSVCSDIVSVDMLQRMSITDKSETHRKEGIWKRIDTPQVIVNQKHCYTQESRPDKVSHIQSSYRGDIENVKRDFYEQSRATDSKDA